MLLYCPHCEGPRGTRTLVGLGDEVGRERMGGIRDTRERENGPREKRRIFGGRVVLE